MTAFRKQSFPFGDLLNVEAYSSDDRIFLLDDNQIGFGFLCRPLPGSDGKEADQLKASRHDDFVLSLRLTKHQCAS